MNKTIAFLILGVILLAMALIMVNQYVAPPPQSPEVGTVSVPPQTGGEASGASVGQGLSSEAGQTASLPPWANPMPDRVPLPTAPPAIAPSDIPGSAEDPVVVPPLSPSAASGTGTARTPEPVQVKPASATKPPAPTSAAKPAAAPVAPAGPKTISRISVISSGDMVIVRMEGSEALNAKTMHFKGPDRLVVDLPGTWAIKAPGVPANKYVSNIRIGKQTDKTRIVIDLKQAPGGVNFVKSGAATLEARIR